MRRSAGIPTSGRDDSGGSQSRLLFKCSHGSASAVPVFFGPQTADGPGQLGLRVPVLLHTFLLQKGLLRSVLRPSCPVDVNVLRPLRRGHQKHDLPCFDLHQSGGNGRCPQRAAHRLKPQLPRHHSRDHIAVVGEDPHCAVRTGHHHEFAVTVKEQSVRGQDLCVKRAHQTSPSSIFFALATTSSSVPTL